MTARNPAGIAEILVVEQHIHAELMPLGNANQIIRAMIVQGEH